MQERNLTIYFTSDLHSYIYPTDYRSQEEKDLGLFKCASQFQKDGNTLVIDGGDLLQGSPLGAFCHDTVGSAAQFAQIMNRCGYDYVTLGNHDFNYGMPYLDSYLDALRARCVCENVRWAGGGVRFPARVHVLENGLRIGIVGIVTDYVNIWERPEHLSGIRIKDPIPAAAAALLSLKGKVDLTVCVYHGGFERDLASGRTLSATHENVAYRICQELDFDILLTGHQHMSVPGQLVRNTFVVQPSDKGQEFLRVEAVVSDSGTRFSSRTIRAGGPCRAEWLAEFSGMERGAQASGRAADTGYAAAHGRERDRARGPVQHRAAGRERRADLRHEPCQRRGGSAADRAAQGYPERLSLHKYADGAADHRRGPAPGDGAQRGVFHPERRRDAPHFGRVFKAEGRALQLRLLCRRALRL